MLLRLVVALLLFLSLTQQSQAEPLQQISLQLIWKHQFQFAGYYMAQQKGFYRDVGIDLKITEFTEGDDPVEKVLEGQHQFAIGRSTILAQKAKGADIVALMAAYQSSPLMLLTTEESGIQSPEHLRGKKIMMTADAENQVELLAMLQQSNILRDDFTRVDHTFNIQSLINGEADAMASYISNEPFQLEQLGIKYNIIHPKNYGFSMYSDILFTSGSYLKQNPELVADFRQASIKGWQFAFDHIDETVDVILKHYNSQNRSREALLFEGKVLRQQAFTNNEFGIISREKLGIMLQLYLLFKLIDADYSIEDFIYKFQQSDQLNLSPDEIAFIATAPRLKLCGDPLWEPYSQLNLNQYEGIIPDYISLIMERAGLSYETVTTQVWNQTLVAMKMADCDLIAGAMQTPDRSQYINFTRPYLSMPAVLAVTNNYSSTIDIDTLMKQPIALINGSAFHEIIQDRYRNTRIVPVISVEQGLKKVQQGEVVAMLDTADTISSTIDRFNLSDLKIINPGYDNWDISIAVGKQWDDSPLLSILNKGIDSISQQERDNIRSRWIRIRYEEKIDRTILWQLFGAITLISLFFAYRYNIMQRHNKELLELARHDQLTGLYNRRMLNESLLDSTAVADRYGRPLSLIFFDIDDFKLVNDQFGHKTGDQTLIKIADLLHKNCRLSDFFGRWGGEEFLIILPESPLNNAEQSAEKLRAEIENYLFDPTLKLRLTCSFGIAEYQPNESLESFVNRADQALYRAKAAGKNCICKDDIVIISPNKK